MAETSYNNVARVKSVGFPYSRIILHHTGEIAHEKPYPHPEWKTEHGEPRTWVDAIKEEHKTRKNPSGSVGIKGYNYIIDREGNVHEETPYGETGEHAKGMNADSLGIALMGYSSFTPEQQQKLLEIIVQLRQMQQSRLNVIGHKTGEPNFDWEPLVNRAQEY